MSKCKCCICGGEPRKHKRRLDDDFDTELRFCDRDLQRVKDLYRSTYHGKPGKMTANWLRAIADVMEKPDLAA